MGKCKGVLLDIDNTLYPYLPCHHKGLQAAVGYLKTKCKFTEDEFWNAYRKARGEIHLRLHGQAASHNRLLYFQNVLEILRFPSLKWSLAAYEKYWQAYLSAMRLTQETKAFLKSLQGKKVCLLTDLTSDIQFKKVKRLGLSSYVECMVTSEEAGIEKPHKRMFLRGLGKLKLTAKDVVMIGDDLPRDIHGAARLGISSVWFIKYLKPPLPKLPLNIKHRVAVCRQYNEISRHLK